MPAFGETLPVRRIVIGGITCPDNPGATPDPYVARASNMKKRSQRYFEEVNMRIIDVIPLSLYLSSPIISEQVTIEVGIALAVAMCSS